ncbi:MAG: hypothetical protein FWC09_03400 [Lachnospiraceae bacterium]|nr:hypothetical protein [Lachnospiraceae bacterium]
MRNYGDGRINRYEKTIGLYDLQKISYGKQMKIDFSAFYFSCVSFSLSGINSIISSKPTFNALQMEFSVLVDTDWSVINRFMVLLSILLKPHLFLK